MLVKVLNNRDVLVETNNFGTQNENNIEELVFEIPEAYNEFDKEIVFITPDGNLSKEIVNDIYVFENDITIYNNIKAYIRCYNSETEEDFRSKIFDVKFYKNENATDEIPEETQIN